jgi:hypothetical protein
MLVACDYHLMEAPRGEAEPIEEKVLLAILSRFHRFHLCPTGPGKYLPTKPL